MVVEDGHHLEGMEVRPPQPVEDLEGAGGVAFVDGAGEVVGGDTTRLTEIGLEVVDVDPGAFAVRGPEHVEQGRDPAGVVAEPVGEAVGGRRRQLDVRAIERAGQGVAGLAGVVLTSTPPAALMALVSATGMRPPPPTRTSAVVGKGSAR